MMKCIFIYHPTATGVDKERRLLHLRECIGSDHSLIFWKILCVNRDKVGLG